jgi:pyrroloquinoline quinone biosynthesis protein B
VTRRQLLKNALGLAAISTARLPAEGSSRTQRAPDAPVVIVLGTAQDGGVPQANCFRGYCARVRAGEVPAPRVACLGIVDPASGERFLIDATPDFVAQIGDLITWPRDRHPTGVLRLEEEVQGILLTHAHMGHYTGLLNCGREAAATTRLPVYASRSMARLLSANEPFKRLVDEERLEIHQIDVGDSLSLTANITVEPFSVVHRAELTDTLGLLISGPRRSLLYVPDADTWNGWPVPFAEWLDRADVAVLDGTFYSAEELGHRWQGEVPHPPVAETVELLAPRLSPAPLRTVEGARAGRPEPVGDDERLEVWFTHLNHTNPLWEADSPERAAIREAGFGVAWQGQTWEL